MGLLDHVNHAVSGAKQAAVKPGKEDHPPEGAAAEDVEELDEESGNILMSLIGQLRIGMDLSKVTLPTFVLEPRSMLERITDFMSHPDLIFGAGKIEDAEQRFIKVTQYYLSGWHIKPKGVKKPYNPVLGEHFRCSWTYQNGTKGYYIAEQVSHHPPISAYFYCSPENDLIIYGELKPKSKFLGNSAATLMGGENRVVLLDRLDDEEYEVSMPNMYARGILFGRMVLELGDHARVNNGNTELAADIEFKTKGYFTGTYNAIAGKVTRSGKTVGELTGKWNESMEYKHSKSGESETLFDASTAKTVQKTVRPEEEQEEFESRRLWSKVTEGIKEKNLDKATDSKSAIEEAQRQRVKDREEKGETWQPTYFVEKGEKYFPKMDALPEEMRSEKVQKYFGSRA